MRDGHANQCKLCQNASNKKWREKNPERARDLNAAWRAANPEAWKAARDRAYEKSKGSEATVRSSKTRQARVEAASTGDVVSLIAVLERHGMHCLICDKPIEHKSQLTYDHVIPIARGGLHTEENLRPAHRTCNSWKNDRLPEELVGLTPPEPGEVDLSYVTKINAAKSKTHKSKHANMTPEEEAAWQAKRQAGVTSETISARASSARATWAAKTIEEREAWAARCRDIKAGTPGNVENLKKGWTPEVQEKARQASAEVLRGSTETAEHKAAISEGLKLAYAEGRRKREPRSEETKQKISETKLRNNEAKRLAQSIPKP